MRDKYRMLTKVVRNMKLEEKHKQGNLLNDNEAEALRYITKHEGCNQNEIVNYLNVDKALVTRIIKKLILMDYIYVQNGLDKRNKLLFPKPEALELKMETEDFETTYYKSLFEGMPKEEQDAFFKTLEMIYVRSKERRKSL